MSSYLPGRERSRRFTRLALREPSAEAVVARDMSFELASRIVVLAERRAEWIVVRAALREVTERMESVRAAREAERAESEGVEEVRDMITLY